MTQLEAADFYVPAKLLNAVKKAAKLCSSREVYAVMLGSRHGTRTYWKDTWWPDVKSRDGNQTEDVFTRPAWLEEGRAIAESGGLELIGDIHSHPYSGRKSHVLDRAPSESDWLRVSPTWIRGVCVVSTLRDGRQRVSAKFWPDLRPLRVHVR